MMPGMSGIEVGKRLRADPRTAAIPVLFLSARTQEKDVAAGLEAGGFAFLTKPFSPLQLLEEVRRVLANGIAGMNQGEEGHERIHKSGTPFGHA
jgi:two-component system phosphate regulon response regulator PhoB